MLIGASLPGRGQQGNSTVIVVHNTKKYETERDTESITLDQFLDECNKSPKSRVRGFCVDCDESL